MTGARIVAIDPTTEKYYLPTHRVNNFKAGTPENGVVLSAKGIPILSEAFNPMLKSLKADGPRGKNLAQILIKHSA